MGKKKTASRGVSQTPSIEAAMEELQDIVNSLESGQEPLDASLQKFERGMALLRSCHQQLDTAASRIEILTGIEADGHITVSAVDGTATAAKQQAAVGPEQAEADGTDDDSDDGSTLF